jgi:hypothetical protein
MTTCTPAVGEHSPSVCTTSPTGVTVTVGIEPACAAGVTVRWTTFSSSASGPMTGA